MLGKVIGAVPGDKQSFKLVGKLKDDQNRLAQSTLLRLCLTLARHAPVESTRIPTLLSPGRLGGRVAARGRANVVAPSNSTNPLHDDRLFVYHTPTLAFLSHTLSTLSHQDQILLLHDRSFLARAHPHTPDEFLFKKDFVATSIWAPSQSTRRNLRPHSLLQHFEQSLLQSLFAHRVRHRHKPRRSFTITRAAHPSNHTSSGHIAKQDNSIAARFNRASNKDALPHSRCRASSADHLCARRRSRRNLEELGGRFSGDRDRGDHDRHLHPRACPYRDLIRRGANHDTFLSPLYLFIHRPSQVNHNSVFFLVRCAVNKHICCAGGHPVSTTFHR